MDKKNMTPMHYAARYASIYDENHYIEVGHLHAWYNLFKASEGWCERNETRPNTLMKRPQSQILRTDQSWGDFTELKNDTLEEMKDFA